MSLHKLGEKLSFYESVEQRLEKLTSLEETINHIDSLNDIILHLLGERSKHPACMDHFSKREGNHQEMLESYGIDTKLWVPVYSKIIEKICPQGNLTVDNVGDIIYIESQLERFVFERIMIGRKVAEYKIPLGRETEDKERESNIINYVREEAPKYNLNPDTVEEIFIFLMKKNKKAQESYKKGDVFGIEFLEE